MLREEGAQVFRQKRHDGRQVGDHAHVAAQPLGMLGEFLPDLVDAEQDAPRVGQRPFLPDRQEKLERRQVQPSQNIVQVVMRTAREGVARNAGRSDQDNHGRRAPSNRMFATPIRQTRTLSPADNGS